MSDAAAGMGIGRPVTIGLIVIGLFFGVLGGWAAFAPIDSAAIASGVVSVDTKRKTVQHLEGGIVGAILVRDGDQVTPGQVLVRLDETQPRANLAVIRGRYLATLALEARLVAERDGIAEISFPDVLMADPDDAEIASIITTQNSIFEARKDSISGQEAILKQRIVQYRAEIEGLRDEIKAQDESLDLSDGEIKVLKKLVSKGMSAKTRMLELQRDAARIKGERSRNRSAIARVHQDIAETRLEVTDLYTQRLNEVVQELREVRTELFDLKEKLRSAQDVMQRTEIKASIAGTVVGMSVHTIGGVIAPGEPVMDIVPTGERLIVEARVQQGDIDVVEAGMTGSVSFPALSSRSQIPVDAKVLTVSADSFTDERTGEAYYESRVEIVGDLAEALQGHSLYPGMQADVMITTGARTPLEYLFKPIQQSLNRAFRED